MSSIYRRGEIFWWKGYDASRKRYRYQSLQTTSRTVAHSKKAILDEAFYGRRLPTEARQSLSSALTAYLDATRLHRGEDYQYVQRCNAGVLDAAFGKRPLETVTTGDIEAVLNRLRTERHLSPTTYNHYRKLLVGFTRWCLSRGQLFRDPMLGIPRMKETPLERLWLPYERWEAFLALGKDSPYGLMAATALLTGLRPKELAGLEWRDLDWGRAILTVRAEVSKTRRARYVPLPDRLVRLLKPLAGTQGLCFPDASLVVFQRTVKRWLQGMGLRGALMGPYILRHSYGARLAELLPAFQIQQLMGHQDIKTTQRYVHAHEIHLPTKALQAL